MIFKISTQYLQVEWVYFCIFLHIVELEHKSVNTLIEQALTEFLEDYYDTQLAKAAIDRLQRGESELLSLEDAV